MLNYTAIPAAYNYAAAFRRRHFHLAFGLLLNLLVSIILVPLSAYLLTAQTVQMTSQLPVNFTSRFEVGAITAKTNLQPFIDLATAIQAYDSSPPPWMTMAYAFEKFSLSGNGNMTANTTAYSAVLDCRTIDPSAYTIDVNQDGFTVSTNDRGCSVSTSMPVGPNTPLYASAWYTYCNPYGRFGMLAGQYSPSATYNLSEFSVTSCVPTYWQTDGLLTVSTKDASYVSFVGSNQTQIYPQIQFVFENALRDYTVFNPAAAALSDAVGFAIYSAALKQDPNAPLDASNIANATRSVYSTVYASLAHHVLLQQDSRAGSASLTTAPNRLIVVSAIAYTIVVFLFLVLACHITLFVYAHRHHTMLDEEPIGLLGAAKLLRESNIFGVVDDFESRHPAIGEMQEYMVKHYREGRCWWDQGLRVERFDE